MLCHRSGNIIRKIENLFAFLSSPNLLLISVEMPAISVKAYFRTFLELLTYITIFGNFGPWAEPNTSEVFSFGIQIYHISVLCYDTLRASVYTYILHFEIVHGLIYFSFQKRNVFFFVHLAYTLAYH